ncbi:hypothetical protein [Pelagicoccus sp. SDUM812002]|uniref:hypothetical protein n=1 Tax=Pelagicoccus sp. SDUM812002 TaxID=3041266 RepID=UPI00280C818A|nr:hypothetical protein [Pelagicoccus sp. SDUM812002]MDQ8186988.1 hypothetical protein [Pelagicoccus sp. SDUM812002]
MKTFVTLLAAFNTLPLALWVFTAAPLYNLVGRPISDESALSQFCGYGFIWGALLYPIILVFNHTLFIRNYRKAFYRRALQFQLITTIYLVLVFSYGHVAFR